MASSYAQLLLTTGKIPTGCAMAAAMAVVTTRCLLNRNDKEKVTEDLYYRCLPETDVRRTSVEICRIHTFQGKR